MLAPLRLRETELLYANNQFGISGGAFRRRLARQMEEQHERAGVEILDVVPDGGNYGLRSANEVLVF